MQIFNQITTAPTNVQSNEQYLISNSFLFNVGGICFQSLSNVFLFTTHCMFYKCTNTNGGGILFRCTNSNANISYCCFVANSITNAYGQAIALLKTSSSEISYIVGISTSQHVSSAARARDTIGIDQGPAHLTGINNTQNHLIYRSFIYLGYENNVKNTIEFAFVAQNSDTTNNFICFAYCNDCEIRNINFIENSAITFLYGSSSQRIITNCLFFNNTMNTLVSGSVKFVDCIFDRFSGNFGIDSFEVRSIFSNVELTLFATYLCPTKRMKKRVTCIIKSTNKVRFPFVYILFLSSFS